MADPKSLKRPRTEEEEKGASTGSNFFGVLVIPIKEYQAVDPADFVVASRLVAITLTQIAWPVPPPATGYKLSLNGSQICYADPSGNHRDDSGNLRITMYATTHGSPRVLRDGDDLIFLPHTQFLGTSLYFGTSHCRYNPDRAKLLLECFMEQHGDKGVDFESLRALGSAMSGVFGLADISFEAVMDEVKTWNSTASESLSVLLASCRTTREMTRSLASVFLSRRLKSISLIEFFESHLKEMSLETSLVVLRRLKMGLPLKALPGNAVDKTNVKLTPVPLRSLGVDNQVLTSSSTLTLSNVRALTPTTLVYAQPDGGLFRSTRVKGKQSLLVVMTPETTSAGLLQSLAVKAEGERPTIAVPGASSSSASVGWATTY